MRHYDGMFIYIVNVFIKNQHLQVKKGSTWHTSHHYRTAPHPNRHPLVISYIYGFNENVDAEDMTEIVLVFSRSMRIRRTR